MIVEAEGYVDGYVKDAEVVSESSAEEIEIRLSRGRLLEGRVVDAVTGRPVRGADLVFGVYRWNADIDWTVLENSRAFLNQQKSSTGDDGAFRFREVDPGVLFVRAPDYCRRIVEPEGRAAYTTTPGSLVIPLAPAEQLRGVLALDGRPLADTAVWIARLVRKKVESGAAAFSSGEQRSGTNEGLSREWVGYLKTDEHGEAAWNEIPAGAYLMDVLLITHPEQKQGVHIRRRFEVRPGVENRIEFCDGFGGLSFKGRLLDPDGRPADNVTLTVRPEFRWDYFELAFDISTRNRGEFHFPRLEPGRYEVEAVEYSDTERGTRLGTIELTEDTTRDLVLRTSGDKTSSR